MNRKVRSIISLFQKRDMNTVPVFKKDGYRLFELDKLDKDKSDSEFLSQRVVSLLNFELANARLKPEGLHSPEENYGQFIDSIISIFPEFAVQYLEDRIGKGNLTDSLDSSEINIIKRKLEERLK